MLAPPHLCRCVAGLRAGVVHHWGCWGVKWRCIAGWRHWRRLRDALQVGLQQTLQDIIQLLRSRSPNSRALHDSSS